MNREVSNFARLIARLDVKGPNLVKPVRFDGLRSLGSPNLFAREYYKQGADELLYIDVVASLYNREHLSELLRDVTEDVFIPITVAGGARSVEDVRRLLRAGADKVAMNTAAVRNPSLIRSVAESFGSQCVVLSVEAKNKAPGQWEVYVEGGREPTAVSVLDWVEEACVLGAGEILLTSIDSDGVRRGPDFGLVEAVGKISSAPVIASGGIRNSSDARKLLVEGFADAVALASALHYGDLTFQSLRTDLQSFGLEVRPFGGDSS
jgi:imidazole glycerol-phosphate synthase subunit HisF